MTTGERTKRWKRRRNGASKKAFFDWMENGGCGDGKQQKGMGGMIDNVDGNSRALEDAIKNAVQAKVRLANERKKQNKRRRKAENRLAVFRCPVKGRCRYLHGKA